MVGGQRSDNNSRFNFILFYPIFRTVATFVTKSRVLAVDWVAKDERYLMTVNSNGVARLLDSHASRPVWELGSDNSPALKGLR